MGSRAGVREEREPEGRARGLVEHATRRGTSSHRVAVREGLLPRAQVVVRSHEHDFDLSDEAADDFREAGREGRREHGVEARGGEGQGRGAVRREGGAGGGPPARSKSTHFATDLR